MRPIRFLHKTIRGQSLRRLTGCRAALVAVRTAIKNRLHSMLAQWLLAPPVQLLSLAGMEWLQTVPLDADLARQSDLRLLKSIDKEIDVVNRE